MNYPPLHMAVVLSALGVAALLDVQERRIPNALCAGLAVAGIGAQLVAHGWEATLWGILAGMAVIVIMWGVWTRGGIGGGDVKFAAATAIWLGVEILPVFFLAAALAGGVVAGCTYCMSRHDARLSIRRSLVLALWSRRLPPTTRSADRPSVPYAVAIALGGSIALFWPVGGPA